MKGTEVIHCPLRDKDSLPIEQGVPLTEWMQSASACGPSGYPVNTNLGWCYAEVDRLAKKKVVAAVLKHGTEVQVVKFMD